MKEREGQKRHFLQPILFGSFHAADIELLCFEMAEYVGHNLTGLTLPSVWACQGACLSHADCHFFTFYNATDGCALKGQTWANARAKEESTTALSGQRTCLN